jgi:4-amino-4-deoxy-L-arabinose transferase-like glycosyltransferase
LRRLNLEPLLVFAILALYAGLTTFKLGWSDLGTDEGRFGLSALNILHDSHQLAIMTEDQPLGEAGAKPFMYPLALATSISLLGKSNFALRVVNLIILALTGLIVYRFIRVYFDDRWLAVLTLAFFLLSPWTIIYARTALPEPLTVFWGCVALSSAAKFIQTNRLSWAAATGIALGFSFLTKLWLVFPFAFGCAVIIGGALITQVRLNLLLGSILSFVLFLLTSALHLFLVLFWTPADLHHWLQLYFVFYAVGRVGGAGFDPMMWFRPWWFYGAGVFKATFLLLPFLLAGYYKIVRTHDWLIASLVLAMLSPLVILSFPIVKQTSYVFPAFPALAFLMAYGCLVFVRENQIKGLLLATLLSMAIAFSLYRIGVLAPAEGLLIATLYLTYVIASLNSNFPVLTTRILGAGITAALLMTNLLALRSTLDHRTYYREIAAFLAPAIASYKPQEVIFQAPEFAAMEFYTFRSGQYWQTYYVRTDPAIFRKNLSDGDLAFCIVDPKGILYGGKPDQEELDDLRRYAVNVTSRIESKVGTSIPVEVFVSRPMLDKLADTGAHGG